ASEVDAAGDVNGDGYDDVIISADAYDNGEEDEGAAFVYLGSASGLGSSPAWQIESNQAFTYLGFHVNGAGDTNGDGYDDVVVTSSHDGNGKLDLYFGSPSGPATSPAWTIDAGVGSLSSYYSIGYHVSKAGDVNGDGFDDLLVGAWTGPGTSIQFQNTVLGFYGGPSGLSSGPAWTVRAGQYDSMFGYRHSGAGDVNGDGFDDVIVGDLMYSNGQSTEGKAFLYLGSRTGLGTVVAWTAESNQVNGVFSRDVSAAGDVNGDGFDDVLIGGDNYDGSTDSSGWAFLYLGSASGLGASPDWKERGSQAGSYFGDSVASAGDINADGLDDVLVGAKLYSNGEEHEGQVSLYLGELRTFLTERKLEPNQAYAQFGTSVASAGDVNGDGYDDVIVGAPYYDNGHTDEGRAFVFLGSNSGISATPAWTAESNQAYAHFGSVVASAGDVNRDGYDDVIISAPDYDGGQTNEGRAYVYHGSASGLSSTAAWIRESNQTDAGLASVASAGDVNGDGYSDVIFGVPYYDNGHFNEGSAIVFLGSAQGLSTNAAWYAEGNAEQALFGASVASAGDVNGDGRDDIIVGASQRTNVETNEGRAYVYYGTATGVSFTPAWVTEPNQAQAQFGAAVASAGDVNGDGFDDIAVGAWLYDGNEANDGRVFVYHGSASGLPSQPSWIAASGQAAAFFGRSVASAGDVNQDGYSDLIVGAYGYDAPDSAEGKVYLYLGSPSGLRKTAAWSHEGDQASAYLGYSVASAGDVNGDGASDVIIGSHLKDSGSTNEGTATVVRFAY
ncbi:MAG: FG-GAP repeat protein, partial [Deltaproteobacteria bacterium]|nr:FG-GAP repeat protein [Deltaproteobacteria bacterium]